MKRKRKLRNQQQKQSLETKGNDYVRGNKTREADVSDIRDIEGRFNNYQAQARAELRNFITAGEGDVGGDSDPDSFMFLEKMVRENGYVGIYNPSKDVYIMFDKVSVTPVCKAKQTMLRRAKNEEERRNREADFAKLGLPVLTVPDSIQREFEALNIGELGEELRGTHREYQEENWRQIDEAKKNMRALIKSLRRQETFDLRKFIDKNKMWIDADDFYDKYNKYAKLAGPDGSSGAEHLAYVDRGDTTRIFKLNNMTGYTNWLSYFNNLAVHNILFPETAYRLEGFVHDTHENEDLGGWRDTDIRPIVSQDYCNGIAKPTEDQMADVMAKKGFKESKKSIFTRTFTNDGLKGVRVHDLHNLNGVIMATGEVVIFDPMVELEHDLTHANFRRSNKLLDSES